VDIMIGACRYLDHAVSVTVGDLSAPGTVGCICTVAHAEGSQMSDVRSPATSDTSEHLLSRLEALAARVEEQAAMIKELLARDAAQQARIAELEHRRPTSTRSDASRSARRAISRSRFFRAAGVAVGALAAGALPRPDTAEAGVGSGQAMTLGEPNAATGTDATVLVNPGGTAPPVLFKAVTYANLPPAPPLNTPIALQGTITAGGLDDPTLPGIGVYGSAAPVPTTRAGSAGVRGDGTGTAIGVLGTAVSTVGVYGASTNSIGMVALSSTSYGLIAQSPSFAGVFYGHHYVTGNLYVAGGKYAAVKADDGSHRLLHAVEAPEAWFADIGSAQLVNGRASIRLDPDFAGVVATQEYHVFVTPKGDTRGLFVTAQAATGFEVREQGGGTGSVAFDYCIIARRKDLVGRPRLEKVTLPELPTLPEVPPARPPEPGERRLKPER
jgi:hypothetical protein